MVQFPRRRRDPRATNRAIRMAANEVLFESGVLPHLLGPSLGRAADWLGWFHGA